MKKGQFARIAFFAFALVWILPLVLLLLSAFRPLQELRKGFFHLGGVWTPGNFQLAFDEGVKSYFLNSVLITAGGVLVPFAAGACAAYAIAFYSFTFRKPFYLLLLSTMVLPIQLILIPLFGTLRTLHLMNSFWGVIFVHGAFGLGFSVFHFVNFFKNVPRELLEAATVDGASIYQIFLRVALPLSLPAIVSYLGLQGIWVWNDLLVSFTFLTSPEKHPLTVGLVNLQSPHFPRWEVVSAGAFLSILPPLFIFSFLQRAYTRALFEGSVRG